tara:strand:- start:79 stop:270 length:192 start_codon:yes stop_codon:yes gene_type:complete
MPPPAAAKPEVQKKATEQEKPISSSLKDTSGKKIIEEMEGGKPAIVQKWEHIYETAFAKAKTD